MTLDRIFEPRSIVVVGASANPAKRGHQILRALGESGYEGRVHAVNPAGGRLLGHHVFPSVRDLPEAADLAVLCTPASTTPGLVRACGERGVGGAVVLAVGFGESGPAGQRLEKQLAEAGRASGVRVVGPNTSGLLNLRRGVNLIGARGMRPGGIALLVQSGNIALSLMNEVTNRSRLGISICCGLGNEVDVGFGEVLQYLGRHDDTTGVIAHIEGCKNARAFLRAATAVTPHKPVIVIKSGRTAAGAKSAASHTGAVAGPYDRLRAGLAQAGVVEVSRIDELFHVTETLASQPGAQPGTGIAILSDGGGQNTLAVDALQEMGAPLATLGMDTQSALRAILGPAAAVRNPVDVAGAADADPGAFSRALDVLAADPTVGVVLVVGLFGGYGLRFADRLTAAETGTAQSMAETMRDRGKGLVVQSIYASGHSAPLDVLRENRVPVIESLEVACRAVVELPRRGGHLARADRFRMESKSEFIAPPDHRSIINARNEGRLTLTEVEARALLEGAGLAFDRAEAAESAESAAVAVDRAVRPVALKLLSRHITHKSDAGGVVLDVASGDQARAAFKAITAGARSYARANSLPDEAYAVMVSPMQVRPVAELLVGACRDPYLGPVLTIGAGGVWVEVLRDVAHRVLPVDPGEFEAMLAELKVNALLAGARGGRPVQLGPIVAAAAAVAECVMTHREIEEVEVNPLFVYEDRVVPVDARVVLRAVTPP